MKMHRLFFIYMEVRFKREVEAKERLMAVNMRKRESYLSLAIIGLVFWASAAIRIWQNVTVIREIMDYLIN